MCPLYPFHFVLLYLCLLLPLLFAVVEGSEELFANWKVTFLPGKVHQLQVGNRTNVTLMCEDCDVPDDLVSRNFKMALLSDDPKVVSLEHELIDPEDATGSLVFDISNSQRTWNLTFGIVGNFLGLTNIKAKVHDDNQDIVQDQASMEVSVVRERDLKAKLFSYSVALLISIAYINMGCALDLQVVKETLKRPIGPAIGFVSQFVAMPLIAFVLGYAFKSPVMRLGLFITGTSPGGGASNIWTLMFGGNLNLSVTMTAISTFAAFFMMPLWTFSLGKVIFSETDIVIPYYKICTYAFCLIVPLGIGLLITRYLPRVSKFMVRILKPMALFLILFIIIFGVWANLYMFELMTWRVLVTGMLLPWLGFAFGCTFARLCNRSVEDVIAIAIETGIQNTGVSIFILWFTLDHPVGDIAAVIPVAAATFTPFPLLAMLGLMKMREWREGKKELVSQEDLQDPMAEKPDVKQSESSQKLMPKMEINGIAA